ncbi:hypothetical protein BG011_006133 [Mortierella polycephala]|uniref:F-box domain-containing protein n=1 Tax=Mortierella polycephala TaxID=41804 RepID=A0A9P6U014_9FUNG|nr:hypothetical protein BG011_006133 [Mortierella polycephala]
MRLRSRAGNSTSPMDRTQPLDLPEIRMLIFQELSRRDLYSCLRVSKSWYTSALPLVWRHVIIIDDSERNPTFKSLQCQRHYIKSLDCQVPITRKYVHLEFPGLETLSIRYLRRQPGLALSRFLALNPTLKRLCFESIYFDNDQSLVWKAVSKLPSLQELECHGVNIYGQHWIACAPKLTKLIVRDSAISIGPFDRLQASIPTMKHLEMDLCNRRGSTIQEHLKFYAQYPALQSLALNLIFCRRETGVNDAVSNEVARFFEADTWPGLVDLDFGVVTMTDEGISKMLRALRNPVRIRLNTPDFGPAAFQELRPHFSTLRRLDLANCPGFTSTMIVEVLESCPLLQELHGRQIWANDIINSQRWICQTSLEIFVAFIRFDFSHLTKLPPDSAEKIRAIFERLSGLTRLKKLDISDTVYGRFWRSLDLRVGNGLELLASLHDMEEIHFQGTCQAMGVRDLEWMGKHWPKLKDVKGMLNKNKKIDKKLTDMFFRIEEIQYI